MTSQPRCTAPSAAAFCRDCRYNPLNQRGQPSRGTLTPTLRDAGCLTRSPVPGKA